MGNKCSLKLDERNYAEDLTEYDKTIYNEKRERVFYGTIAICVLYGSLALLLFLASYLSEKVKFMLLNNFLPFTIVFIIGTIIIISYLIHQVVNFKPFKIDRNSLYDSLSCPDYWTLEKIADETVDDNKKMKDIFSSNVDPNLFKYRCKLNENIFDKYNIYQANSTKGFLDTATAVADRTTEENKDKPYYKYTATTVLDNNIPTSKLTGNDKHLFVNILNPNNDTVTKTVNKKILQDNKQQKYELIKNTLFMNNFELEIDTSSTIKVFKQRDLSSPPSKSNIVALNFDINLTASSDGSNNKTGIQPAAGSSLYIKVDLSTDNIKVYKSSDNTLSVISDTEIKVLPMVCDSTYPMFLASRDEITNKTNPKFDNNTFRCAYSKICKVPWSDMNCDKYEDS
jgi:hypothetical protein